MRQNRTGADRIGVASATLHWHDSWVGSGNGFSTASLAVMVETLAELKQLVHEHREAFRSGTRESPHAVELAERTLGVRLPEAMTWLLIEHGYSSVCGIDSLTQSVEATLRCRQNLGLPHHIVVLNDWNDAGVVYADTSAPNREEMPVYWVATHNLYRLAEGAEMDGDIDRFPSYAAWVECRLLASEHE